MKVLFDIGGTYTRIGISDDGIKIIDVKKLDTKPNFEEMLHDISNELQDIIFGNEISAGGIGVTGVLDKKQGFLIKSPHLPEWNGINIRKKMTERLGCEFVLENDAASEALGEACFGAGRENKIVAYMCVGTGIGGARIVEQKMDESRMGFEPGHMILDYDGQMSRLEEFGSGTAMEKIYGVCPENLEDPKAWESETRILAIGVHNMITMWSPDVVVLGGSVAKKIDFELLNTMVSEMVEIFPEAPRVVPAELGDQAGLLGLLMLVR